MPVCRSAFLRPALGCAFAFLLAVAGPLTTSAQAGFKLSDLLAGTSGTNGMGSIIVNTKAGQLEFYAWKYEPTGDMPIAGDVLVDPFIDLFGNAGIDITGGFFDDPTTGNTSDAGFGYRVRSVDGRRIIKDNILSGDPFVGGGPGQVLVTEQVYCCDLGTPIGTKAIFYTRDANGNVAFDDFDRLEFDPRRELLIDKDIFANASSTNTIAGLSIIKQSFSVVPEPTSMAMVGVGLLGVTGLAVRRRKV